MKRYAQSMNDRENGRKHTIEPVDEAATPPLAPIHLDTEALPPESVHENAVPPTAPFKEVEGSYSSSGDEGASSAIRRGTSSRFTEPIGTPSIDLRSFDHRARSTTRALALMEST